jgi:hypothetical protein
MIMKMKYAVAFLASLAIIAMAASVPAQQDAPTPKDSTRSADLAPVITSRSPYYSNDAGGHPLLAPGQRGLFSHPTTEWRVAGSPEHNQLAEQESTLAHEANEIRHRLESATTDAQRSDVRTKLAENLGKQFDLRQKRHGLEIEALEAQVKKLKELVQKRQESRAEIISRRTDQVLREAEGLGW